ncbi:hypothetical protein BC835DRAFT_1372449 [Cytidiella melzeri]|nr:hypothetical protein BC835DRAFT_1372449 [Cytidiella melzeri]
MDAQSNLIWTNFALWRLRIYLGRSSGYQSCLSTHPSAHCRFMSCPLLLCTILAGRLTVFDLLGIPRYAHAHMWLEYVDLSTI